MFEECEESESRAAEKSRRSRRVVCLSSQIRLICARAAWSERRTQTLIFCRPYLSRARDCRTSHGVALVNALRVRFSSDIPRMFTVRQTVMLIDYIVPHVLNAHY